MIFQGKTEAARRVLEELAADDPEAPDVLGGLANAAWWDGDAETARELALRARGRIGSATTDPADILLGIGTALADIPGAEQDAIDTLGMVVESDPEDELGHLLLAVYLAGTDDEAATRHYDRARALWRGGAKSFDALFEGTRDQVHRMRSAAAPPSRDPGREEGGR